MTTGTLRFSTAWGMCRVDWTARGIARVRILDGAAGEGAVDLDTVPLEVADCVRRLESHFRGDPVDFSDVGLDETGLGALDRAIYRELRRVPRGRTVTYGELAARVGAPGASQAVGAAMGRNPWPVVVPCHRVLAKGGGLGGFSAPGGVATKRRLLALEGVDLDGGAPMLPGLFDLDDRRD